VKKYVSRNLLITQLLNTSILIMYSYSIQHIILSYKNAYVGITVPVQNCSSLVERKGL